VASYLPARTPRRRRGADLLQGLLALLALAVLLVGIPLALWRLVGWPLPHAVPSLPEIRAALQRPLPDTFFPKLLAAGAWLYWLQFLACAAVEVAAALRHGLPSRVPLGAVNQAIASQLIATALTLLSPTAAATRPTAASPPPPAVVVDDVTPAALAAPSSARTTLPPGQPLAAASPTAEDRPLRLYVVKSPHGRHRDTLWGIAERHLGDGQRWRDIFGLNQGREQPDGRRLTDPHWIYPGWQLLMPADASGMPAAPSPSAAPAPRHRSDQDGDQSDTAPPLRPPATREQHPTPAPPATTAPEPPTTPPTTSPVSRDDDDPSMVAPLLVAVTIGGLLAAGVIATLTRLRRIQQRRRPPGRRIRLPDGDAARTESRLRVAAEPESARFLDAGLRAMAAGIRRDRLPAPTVDAVLLGPTTLEVMLRAPSDAAPAPFALAADPRRWTLPREIALGDLEAAGADALAPLPGLVTLGTSDQGQLLVNLEAAGLTALAGPASASRPLLDAMAVELAAGSSSGFVQVLLIGFGPELDLLERVRRTDSLDQALADLERQADEAGELVDRLGCGSVLGGRVAGVAADSWTPTVVLLAQPPAPAALQRLAALTAHPSRSTVAAVLAGDADQAAWRLQVSETHVRVPALDLELRTQRLRPDEYAAIGALLSAAADVQGVAPSTPPYDTLQPLAAADLEEAAVEVRVLGRVDLAGVRRIERSKAIELIAYLALHPQGATPDEVWEALWPERPVNRGTLHTTVTAARSGLGRAPDGTRYLPDAHDGRYRLSPQLGVDWARFHPLVGRGEDAADGLDALRQALELVRGVPLTSPTGRGYEWAVVHQTEMETVIAEVAERLALRCLDLGDHPGANWAARRGLLASPYDERLYRVLMRAAHAAGNPAGVDAVWNELLSVLDADLELIDDELHPETVALYTTLRPRGRRRPTGPQQPRSSIPQN
jgi:DNA-binding SARP family transcriptional activator